MRGRRRVVLLTTLVLTAFAGAAFADPKDPGLESEMRAVGFTAAQVAAVRSGGLVTRLRLQREDNAAFVIAVTRIASPEAMLVDEIRSVGRPGWTPAGDRTLRAGRFSEAPVPADLQSLRLERQDLRDLARCRVGDLRGVPHPAARGRQWPRLLPGARRPGAHQPAARPAPRHPALADQARHARPAGRGGGAHPPQAGDRGAAGALS